MIPTLMSWIKIIFLRREGGKLIQRLVLLKILLMHLCVWIKLEPSSESVCILYRWWILKFNQVMVLSKLYIKIWFIWPYKLLQWLNTNDMILSSWNFFFFFVEVVCLFRQPISNVRCSHLKGYRFLLPKRGKFIQRFMYFWS